uniref:Uncharacterized protein n=1 Tax=Solanum tuberosum TaxID=4113 RepID=M0ZU21_SOLTU
MSIEQLRYCREILEKGKYLMLCQVVLKLMILELISALKTGKDLVPSIGRNKCRSMRFPLIQLLLQVLLRPGEFS